MAEWGLLEEELPSLAVELDGEENRQGKHTHSSQEDTNLDREGVYIGRSRLEPVLYLVTQQYSQFQRWWSQIVGHGDSPMTQSLVMQSELGKQ